MATSLKIKDATAGAKTKTTKVVKKRVVKKVAQKVAKRAAKKTTKRTSKKTVKKVTKKRTSKKATKTASKKLIAAQVINRADLFKQRKPQPLGHLMVEHKLHDAGFRGEVSSDAKLLERYSTDESIFAVRPQIVLQPKRSQDVEIAVKVLGAETKKFQTLSLTPRAAGTGLSGG
ncbi:MAG TPA: hypothetical protein VKP88_02715, partial [Candidatus Paceibacterota bacterium]|nr:hypothetical protein [Candidatus Paceibacterota bacterium]